ncbi:unnamed protein product [Phaedon cochleariae]|uniref:Plexin domain-containing protein 2 n=1 Tax=Phaedon cochleariae TaxID=80249 RepID=A0A9P0DVI7_PHACE|nr:unnamed protein product [Phaedon cochleariae]
MNLNYLKLALDIGKMAKLPFLCERLILFLLISNGISSVLSNYDADFYETDFPSDIPENDPVIELLNQNNAVHTLHKRNIVNGTVIPTSIVTPSVTSQKPIVAVVSQKTNTILPTNFTLTSLRNNLAKNLGENGTGIRKNYTSSTTPVPLVHKMISNVSLTTTEKDDDADFGIPRFPSDLDTEEGTKKFNESLTKHNITNSKTDPNLFYNSSILHDKSVGHFYWVDMKNRSDVKVNELLSQSHRRAATIKLSFDFPFYGHLIKNVTIATGGFLYTGDYVHSWLAATQYIAPLMANFDTSLSNDSFIKYLDNGTAFTVQWENVALQDMPADGNFTFQVTLFKSGDIVFVYREVPLQVEKIQELHHPVKVGLSDAYIMDHTVFLVRRKTIYEYDRVHFNKTYIKDWTTIYLSALPTCLDAHDCETCLTRELKFKCQWCPTMAKCSEGFDRHRQTWLANGCERKSFQNASMCSISTDEDVYYHGEPYQEDPNIVNHDMNDDIPVPMAGQADGKRDVGVSGIMAILFLVAMVSGLSVWVLYAYRNPHTTSGQMLIRYRPSQWRWRRGEARYTAATIHM